jgi:uncharacterized protein YkvS
MNQFKQARLKKLIEKYNEVLLNTMASAISEDLLNLIIVNEDDKDFELNEFINNRIEYKEFVMREFFKVNSSSVIDDLKLMDEPQYFNDRKKRAQTKLKL